MAKLEHVGKTMTPEESEQLALQSHRNIQRTYAFSFFWMFLVMIPVFVPYLQFRGFSMQTVFTLQVIFGLTVLICEVPSGYFSDLIGRRLCLICGALCSGMGYTVLFFAHDFWQFVLFEIILGLAMSLVSGTDISLLYDWQKLQAGVQDREASTAMVAQQQLMLTGSESIASILGGLLVIWSYSHVLGVQMLVSWIPFLVSLTIQEPPFEKMEAGQTKDNLTRVMRHLWGDPFIRLVVMNMVLWGLATFVAVWIFQKHWQLGGIPLASFGLLWAGYNLTVGIIGKQVARWEKRYGSLVLLGALSLLPVAGYLGLAWFSGWIGICLGLCFQVSRGITQVILKDALNWRTPSAFRATANSMVSLFFRLGFAILGPLSGYGIDNYGIRPTLMTLAFFFLLGFLGLMLPLMKAVQMQGKQPQSPV